MTDDLSTVEPPRMDRLDEASVETIHEASVTILEEMGIKVDHEEGQKILAENGCSVDDEGMVTFAGRERTYTSAATITCWCRPVVPRTSSSTTRTGGRRGWRTTRSS